MEAALTINANLAAMTSANLRNEPNNLSPGYYFSNNNSAIIVINNPLPTYDDVMITGTSSPNKLMEDAPPTYEDATFVVNN